MSDGTGWDKNFHQSLEEAYKKLLQVLENKRPEWFSVMEGNKDVAVLRELEILKQLFDPLKHVNEFADDFKTIHGELQPIYKKWSKKLP